MTEQNNDTEPTTPDPVPDAPEPGVYDDLKVEELREKIASRNAVRPDDKHLPTEGKKADLVSALEADDEAPTPKPVTLKLYDVEVKVLKPSAEYTQLVHGYGYKEA